MTDDQHLPEQAAVRGLLRTVGDALGHDVAPEWARAAEAAPRHSFLPDRVWLDRDGTYRSVDRREDPAGWTAGALADEPVVTQLNDGTAPGDPSQRWPSSSSSAPSVVFRMLELLDLQPGMRVLEVGTGTGWTSALMSHRLGDANVTTVEVDPALALSARVALKEAGFSPEVVCGDGALGWGRHAPYDRVVSTCSVRRVPAPWIDQTRPGGVILTPWDNPWICWGLLRLTVGENGTAVGRYLPVSSFMLMRTQRQDLEIHGDVVQDGRTPQLSTTTLPRRQVVRGDAAFAIGHRIGDIWHAWQDKPADGVADRLWVATTDSTSWAAVDHDGGDHDQFTVRQHGPRRLWDEIERAHSWWQRNDCPGPERFGLTVTPEGHRAWLDDPANSWPLHQ
ncbi:methyltransferase domain-containing protein [Kitasatospora sp. NPDC059827]|uniref:methyltransferase domain-containing protein n=1 Tax=Kitasatospora sp. NPDC059827 TaxID=3346964 RepID=UPI00364ABCE4